MVIKQIYNKLINHFLVFFAVSICIFMCFITNVKAADDYVWDWETDASITPSTVINGNKITCSIADVVNGERTGGASLFTNDVGSLNLTMYLYRYADADSTSYLSRKSITHTYSYDQFEWTYPSMRDQRDAFLTFDFSADKEYIGNYYYQCQYEWSGTVNYYSYSGTMNGTTHGGTRQRIAVNNAGLTLNAYYNGGTFPDGDISKTFYTKYNDVYANRLNVYTGIQNSTVGTIPKPKKNGYTFSGWYTSNLGGVKILNADNTFAQSSNTGYISYIGFSTWGMTENKTLYAQFNDGITYSVYLNDGFGSTPSSPAFYYKYDYSTQIGSDSSRRCYYFTNSSLSTCVNTPTNPLFYVTSEPATRTNYTFDGYYTGQKGAGTKYILSSGLATMSSPYLYEYTNNNNSNVTLYGNWKITIPATPTITGGATKIYNSTDTSLTCATTSTYADGINLKYSFGYATSDGGTPSNWTTPATSNVYVIPKNSYVGQRWYSCKVYAEDDYGFVSDTVESSTSADTAMTINNASITFNVSSNGGTISGTSPLYSKYGVASLYTGIRNTTAGTIPTATKTGYLFNGWWTAASGGSKVINADKTVVASVSGWTNASKQFLREANSTLYAQFTIDNPATPTITGGATKVYNASDTTLTCATSTTYSTGISKYYSFGYATSDGGTPSNWTTPTTSNTLSITKDAYVGQRWYSCRVYATDGTLTSSTVASATTADTPMTINNASITFNANSGTISGTSPLYSKYGVASLYTGIRNTTAGTIPTATKTGYTFNGWWTTATDGSKVINNDKTVVPSISGWTNASKQFLRTANSMLYAQFTPNIYSVTLNNQNGTTSGTPKVWYEYNTTKTINSETCYYYTDNTLTTCLSSYTITIPTKEHYIFDGYYTEPNGKGIKCMTSDGVFTNNIFQKLPSEINNSYTDDIILYANWTGEPITVTLPDNITESYHYGDSYTLGENNVAKANDNGALITFKYQDDETSDTTESVTKSYTPNGWLINDVEHSDNEVIVLTEDITLNYNYNESYTSPIFPEPTREHYGFDGWYDEETEGNQVISYTGSGDTTLYAHWTVDTRTVTILDEEEIVPYGTEYTLGTNDIIKSDEELSSVTFKYHDDITEDLVNYVKKEFILNGWLVNGVHYDDEASFIVKENVTITPDYAEVIVPAEFPENPKKDNLAFKGWYDDETFGTKYTSYNLDEDIVLHAQYTDDIITINIPGLDPEIIPSGDEYELPANTLEKANEDVATVTFKLHNEEDDIVRYVTKKFTPNGWLINGIHYDDNVIITPVEDLELVPDYTESLIEVEFPENPSKDVYIFTGWYTEENDGTKYTSYNLDEDIVLHAQYGANEAYLVSGEKFFYQVPNNVNGTFRKATESEYNLVKDTLTNKNIVSDVTSNVPVYMWKSGNNMLYYSTADTIYMNKDSYKMFYYSYFTSIDISGLNSSKVENMSKMFLDCDNLTSLDLSSMDTSSATDMSRMLAQMDNLTTLDVSSFDTSKVTNMEGMFAYDKKLQSIEVNHFDTSNVTNMEYLFATCSKIKTLNIYNWDLSNVTKFANAFRNMTSLETITMSNYYTRSVDDMSYMFAGDTKLQTLDISNFDNNHLTYTRELFSGSTNLTTIYATKDEWPAPEFTEGSNMFNNTTSIVGGQGTVYSSSNIDKTYAVVDDPDNGRPGYFTDVSTIKNQHNVLFHYIDGDVVEKHNHNSILTLEKNITSKPTEVLGTITFKYHDGITNDSTLDVIKSYTPNGWLVNDVHFDDNGKIVIDEDKEIDYDYSSEYTSDELPIPVRDGFEFAGWYTEETGGEKVESYDGSEDIILHAHWDSTYPTDMIVDTDNVFITKGETHLIDVTFTPEGTSDPLTYTDYNGEIISVTEGLITGLSSGETTITVGTENTDITKTIHVTVVSDKLESTIYEVADKENEDLSIDRIVIGAEPETLISEFKENMFNSNEYIKIYDEDDELLDDDIVKTGLTVNLEINGIVYDEAIIIIRGDLNNDGNVNVADNLVLTNHILKKENIEGYKIHAANLYTIDEQDDSEIKINVSDNKLLTDYILRKTDTLNDKEGD